MMPYVSLAVGSKKKNHRINNRKDCDLLGGDHIFLVLVEIFLGVVEILPLFYFCSGRTAKGNNICRPAAKKIDVLFMTDFAWQLAASSQFPLRFIFDRFCLVVGRRALFS